MNMTMPKMRCPKGGGSKYRSPGSIVCMGAYYLDARPEDKIMWAIRSRLEVEDVPEKFMTTE